MPVIFGHEISSKTMWIGGGLIAAAIAVVVFLRARAASAAAAADQTAAPQPDQSQGAGMSIPAPTTGVADQYQQQLNNSQLQAQTIANQYQQQLMDQQQKQFQFGLNQQQALAPYLQQEEVSQLGQQTAYYKAAAAAPVSCPGTASLRTAPDGSLYCRQKTAGFLGIGQLGSAITNFFTGVEAAAPNIGYQAANQAASFELGQVFAPKSPARASGNPAARPAASTAPFFPTPTGGPIPMQAGGSPIGVQQFGGMADLGGGHYA